MGPPETLLPLSLRTWGGSPSRGQTGPTPRASLPPLRPARRRGPSRADCNQGRIVRNHAAVDKFPEIRP